MQPTPPNQTVLFSDIVGSSKLYQKLGNETAEKKIHFIIQTLTACADKYSGRVIKTIGDEIMCAFSSLSDATECSCEMNALVLSSNIELRTGISSGALIERKGDLFGDVVNNAAFLTKTARAREVLIDEMALDNSDSRMPKNIELVAEMTIKGQAKPCKIYRLNWEQVLNSSLGATMVNNVSGAKSSAANKLALTYKEQVFVVDSGNPVFVIGRDSANVALKINHVKISRKHCTLELKQGKFILQDHSTNGTYIKQQTNGETVVHREAFALIGTGTIKLGQAAADEACTVQYTIS